MQDLKPSAEPTPFAEDRATHGQAGALLALVARVGEALDAETAAIRTNPKFDIKASNARKSRHLYELGKAFKGIRPDDLGSEHRDAMTGLRHKLAANEATIQAHLSAVGEVAALLQDAIERAQADGTYSIREFGSQ